MITPTSMLPSPAMRNSRSRTSSSRANARLTPAGLRNGAMPSNTRNSPSAASRSVTLSDTGKWRLAPWRGRLRGILQVSEEFPIGCHDQQIPLLAEGALIGLQAAVEGVELGVLVVGTRVGLRGRGIAFAAHPQRIALRVRQNHGALALGVGANPGAAALPFGAQPAGGLGEALLHALVDTRRDLIGQVDALHAYVDQFDTQ